jgi:hypothetical protein
MAKPVKQPINFSFLQGLDLKRDPYQVQVGSFLSLVNTVFDKVGRLTKRNGFPYLTPLPNTTTSYLTTFNGDLQAVGEDLLALSSQQNQWLDKGSIHPLQLSVLPLVRNSLNQGYSDSAIAPNGLIMTAYQQSSPTGNGFYYIVADSVTGQNVVEPSALPSADATYGTPRVYVVGNYFVVLYTQQPSSGVYSLNYMAIPWTNTNTPPVTAEIVGAYKQASTVAFDAVLLNNTLYISYSGTSSVMMTSLSSLLDLSVTIIVDPSNPGTVFTMAADAPNSRIWVAYWGTDGYAAAVSSALAVVLAPTEIISSGTVLNLASTVTSSIFNFWYEESASVYDDGISPNYITGNTCTFLGTVGSPVVTVRSVGLASKAFLVDNVSYFLSAFDSLYQPTYFIIDATASTSAAPVVVAKIAYQNGGGYQLTGLPNVILSPAGNYCCPYLYKDLIQSVNKNTNVPNGSQVAGIYSQTGINLASFEFTTDGIASTEIGENLNLTGGFLWMYDGYLPVENNFFLYPDDISAVASNTSGSMEPRQYYYQVTYEWTDNQGNAFRSAPSIPVTVTLSDKTSVTIQVPTLRLTYKISSKVKICIYRWSNIQQSYYQVTSITSPILNDTTIDSISYTDTLSDATILGNNLLYTTGGVVEDVNGPSSSILALFDDRMWMVDAEDPNLMWYSKQVIEATPVEMSDLFTYYVAPTTGAEGSTGPITALYPMDDKLIIFKANALYYINGTGPDNTGANSGYPTTAIFIASTVGCSNPRSIVMTPNGLMFQSNKGIWLLGHDLSTVYIGAPVEDFNDVEVTSAVCVPGTNQVRFGLQTTTPEDTAFLLYDYFVNQWGEFEGIQSVSSTLYQNLHTIVNQYGQVSQELANTYLDGTVPVLMSFTTSWLQLAGLRGYMRAFWFSFLGTFLSPHKMNYSIAYDYEQSPTQSDLISPSSLNYAVPYGNQPFYGGSGADTYGSYNLMNWRVFLTRQRCKAFQISMQEAFDPTYGTVSGPGLTLSGLSCMVGLKSSYAPVPQNQQIG